MAKRDFSLSLKEVRRHYSTEEVIGRLGFLAGLTDEPRPCTAAQLLPLYAPEKLPREDIVLPRGLFAQCGEV